MNRRDQHDDLEDVPMDETPADPTRPEAADLDVLEELRSIPMLRPRPTVERVSLELQRRADPDRVAGGWRRCAPRP